VPEDIAIISSKSDFELSKQQSTCKLVNMTIDVMVMEKKAYFPNDRANGLPINTNGFFIEY